MQHKDCHDDGNKEIQPSNSIYYINDDGRRYNFGHFGLHQTHLMSFFLHLMSFVPR